MIKREEILFSQVRDSILSGRYGGAGDRFPTIRTFANEYACSLHCALGVVQRLLDCRILRRWGKHCYITTGPCTSESPYGTILTDTQRQVFGILLNDNSNPFFGALADCLQDVLRQHDAELIVATGTHADQQHKALDLFVELKCRGVFCCVAIPDSLQDFYRYYPLPLVTLAEDNSPLNFNSIVVDNFAAGKQVAAHLLKSDCRSFAYITLDNYVASDMRLQGFRQQLSSAQIPLGSHQVKVVSDTDQDLAKREVRGFLRDLLTGTPQLPLGIFCVHDLLAVEVLRFLKHSTKIRVGTDVKVVGFDDLPIASLVSTPITTVSYPYSAMAVKAVDVMRMLLRAPNHTPKRYEIPSSLMIRQSSQG